jgi:hypothetical protein
MPLTEKGEEILKNMRSEYGEKKGESVFYASKNAGTISGVDELVASMDIADNMLSFGGGYPVSTPTGPGDKPMSPAAAASNAVITDATIYNGPMEDPASGFGRMLDKFKQEAEKVGGDALIVSDLKDGIPELKQEFNQFLNQEEKEKEHEDADPTHLIERGEDEHIGFKNLENELSHEKGVTNPGAVAHAIGVKKYGQAEMTKKSEAGR